MSQLKPSLQATRDPFIAPHFPFPNAPSIKLPVEPLVEEPTFNPGLMFNGPLRADLILHKELEYDILVTISQLLILSKNQELSDPVKDRALIMTVYCRSRWQWTSSDDAIRYRTMISVFDTNNREAGCTGLIAGPWSADVYEALINLRWDLDWKIRILEDAVSPVTLAGPQWMFWPMKQAVDGYDDSSGPEFSLYRHANFDFVSTDDEILAEVGFDDRRSFVWPCEMDEVQTDGSTQEEVQADGIEQKEAQAGDVEQEEEDVQAGSRTQEES